MGDKRPRLQQQRPNQSGAPIQQQQQQRNQNGQQIPIAKNQRSPVPIQRGQQPQQQNNQQPYTFQQQNTSGQRIVQVTQQQVKRLIPSVFRFKINRFNKYHNLVRI